MDCYAILGPKTETGLDLQAIGKSTEGKRRGRKFMTLAKPLPLSKVVRYYLSTYFNFNSSISTFYHAV